MPHRARWFETGRAITCTRTSTGWPPEGTPDARLLAVRFRGIACRAHNPQWAWSPLSGEGARRHGGRFNRRGVPAFYCSLSQLTAIRETQPPGRPMQPLTLCTYVVDAEPVFDARNPSQLRGLGVAEADLASATWEADMLGGAVAALQRLADRLTDEGYVGMLVRSFAFGAGEDDVNLVLWRWGDSYPTRAVLVDDEDRLGGERNPTGSWRFVSRSARVRAVCLARFVPVADGAGRSFQRGGKAGTGGRSCGRCPTACRTKCLCVGTRRLVGCEGGLRVGRIATEKVVV